MNPEDLCKLTENAHINKQEDSMYVQNQMF